MDEASRLNLKIVHVYREGCDKTVISCPASWDEFTLLLQDTLEMETIDEIHDESQSNKKIHKIEDIIHGNTLRILGTYLPGKKVCSPKNVSHAATKIEDENDFTCIDERLEELDVGNIEMTDHHAFTDDSVGNKWARYVFIYI